MQGVLNETTKNFLRDRRNSHNLASTQAVEAEVVSVLRKSFGKLTRRGP